MRGSGGAFALLRSWLGGRGGPETLGLEECAPIPLPGPWTRGIAMAMHSVPEVDDGGRKTREGELLSRFKYGGERALGPGLGKALGRAVRGDPAYEGLEVVTHIPATHRTPAPEPSCELARWVARVLHVRFLPRLIARTRRTCLQKELSDRGEKKRNVTGAFRVRRGDLVQGRKVLLVDDVYDSGATLEEGRRALCEAGAQEVVVATITRTWYRRER